MSRYSPLIFNHVPVWSSNIIVLALSYGLIAILVPNCPAWEDHYHNVDLNIGAVYAQDELGLKFLYNNLGTKIALFPKKKRWKDIKIKTRGN